MSVQTRKHTENLLRKEGVTDSAGNLFALSDAERESVVVEKLTRMFESGDTLVIPVFRAAARWIHLLQSELADARAVAVRLREQIEVMRAYETQNRSLHKAVKEELDALKNAPKVDEAQVEIRVKARLFDQMFASPPASTTTHRLARPGHPVLAAGGGVRPCPGCGLCRPLGGSR